MTDIPPTGNGSWDMLSVFGDNNADFSNMLVWIGGGQMMFRPELGVRYPSPTGSINITNNTWYWLAIAYNLGGSNNVFQVYDTTLHLLGTVQNITPSPGSNANYILLGIANKVFPNDGYYAWYDNVIADFSANPKFPLMPGDIPTKLNVGDMRSAP